MPAKDKYHDIVRTALEKESWQITHDPLKIMLGRRRGYIDDSFFVNFLKRYEVDLIVFDEEQQLITL